MAEADGGGRAAAPALPFTDIVQDLPASIPFVGPETLQRRMGMPFEARVGANESAFGVSPKAAEAMRAAIDDVSWYGDAACFELKQALCESHGVAPEEICVGAGIDALLGVLVRAVVSPGTPVVTSDGAYPTFNYHVNGFGGRLVKVPYRDDHEDREALLDRAAVEGAPLLYFSNPDNPMGTCYDAAAVQAMIDAVPEGRLMVLDEAYLEFAPEGTAPPIDTSDPRVVRMRTFSKAHGMAGARIGYAIAHRDVIAAFDKIRNHFEINRVAQAGALASWRDPEHIARVVAEVARGRAETYATAERLGLAAVPSATNFVAIDMGGDGERARAALAALQEERVFVRMPGVAPLDRCIRVTVGRPDERAYFDAALARVLDRL